MTSLFTIELTINMPDGGRLARKLLNMYFTDMPEDINEAAFNLCDGDKTVQERKFANLTMKRVDAWASQEGSLEIFALMSVSGGDSTFIKLVFAEYMDSFSDYLKRASSVYFSSTDYPPDISLQPTDWNMEMNLNPHG